MVSQRSKRFGFSVMSAVTNRGVRAGWLQRSIGLSAAHQVHGAAGAPDEGAQGGPDPRQPAGASQCAGDGLAAGASERDHVHHLPSYSPELNPDERLNRSLKSKLGQMPAANDERTLHRQTLGQLRSCHRQQS